MQFDYERTTPFSVSAEDVKELLQDPKRFMIAGGGTEEDSIKYDEGEDLWHATSKDSIPIMPKPKYTAKVEKTAHGAKWTISAAMGTSMVHTWTVTSISDEECNATEHVTVSTSALAYYPVKSALPGTQEKTHKCLQEYLS